MQTILKDAQSRSTQLAPLNTLSFAAKVSYAPHQCSVRVANLVGQELTGMDA